MLEYVFQIVAAILSGVAAYYYWQGDTDMTFAAAVLASSAFFLGYRMRLKKRINERQAVDKTLHD